ncbi:MAG: hypothetical protein HQL14_02875 [Candidatus Omnitrophica bacterium]|nr:hypothetical protein [Candidatus Omnitrophota bacterium]
MRLFWKFYTALFLVTIFNNGLVLLNKNSPLSIYYHTMMAFNSWFIVPYLVNIINVLLSLIVAFYILNYAFKTDVVLRAPYWIFYARILSDLTGHSYTWQYIQSGLIQGGFWGWLGLASFIIPLAPSYIVQWHITCLHKNAP